MNVLIGCEYSGRVRDAFRARGHSAMSCDFLETEAPGPHYRGDLRDLLDEPWDLLIAHPDCTYLCSSAAWAFGDGPYHQNVKPGTLVGAARREARERALEFVTLIWRSRAKRLVIENPKGSINRFLPFMPKPQYVHPHQFGDDASKQTGLWMRGLPPLVPTCHIEPRWVCCGEVLPESVGRYGCPYCHGDNEPKPRWANQTDSGQNRLPPTANRWKIRAATYPGIAEAMADQWGRLLEVPNET